MTSENSDLEGIAARNDEGEEQTLSDVIKVLAPVFPLFFHIVTSIKGKLTKEEQETLKKQLVTKFQDENKKRPFYYEPNTSQYRRLDDLEIDRFTQEIEKTWKLFREVEKAEDNKSRLELINRSRGYLYYISNLAFKSRDRKVESREVGEHNTTAEQGATTIQTAENDKLHKEHILKRLEDERIEIKHRILLEDAENNKLYKEHILERLEHDKTELRIMLKNIHIKVEERKKVVEELKSESIEHGKVETELQELKRIIDFEIEERKRAEDELELEIISRGKAETELQELKKVIDTEKERREKTEAYLRSKCAKRTAKLEADLEKERKEHSDTRRSWEESYLALARGHGHVGL